MSNVFSGFTDDTFAFFMAIRFNNNKQFFADNHDWYLSAVRGPCLALAEAIAPEVYELDPLLELRPDKVVSRINRDVRFSNDKSPYRDYMWLGFRRPGLDRTMALGVYFDISDDGASYGMGVYHENKPLMNGLRASLVNDSEAFISALAPTLGEFELHGESYKRMTPPDSLPEAIKAWYPLRGFYIEKDLNDKSLLKSPELADELRGGIARFAPLYRYVQSVTPQK